MLYLHQMTSGGEQLQALRSYVEALLSSCLP